MKHGTIKYANSFKIAMQIHEITVLGRLINRGTLINTWLGKNLRSPLRNELDTM